jgi:hypothetical protein
MLFLVLFGWVPCPWQAAQVPDGKSAVVWQMLQASVVGEAGGDELKYPLCALALETQDSTASHDISATQANFPMRHVACFNDILRACLESEKPPWLGDIGAYSSVARRSTGGCFFILGLPVNYRLSQSKHIISPDYCDTIPSPQVLKLTVTNKRSTDTKALAATPEPCRNPIMPVCVSGYGTS